MPAQHLNKPGSGSGGSSTPRASFYEPFSPGSNTHSGGANNAGQTVTADGGLSFVKDGTGPGLGYVYHNGVGIVVKDFWSANPSFLTTAYEYSNLFAAGEDYQFWMVCGDSMNNTAATNALVKHMGFRIKNNNGTQEIYATNADGTTQTQTLLGGVLDFTADHVYFCQKSETDIKFYIDGVLVATHTTNLPEDMGYRMNYSSFNLEIEAPGHDGLIDIYAQGALVSYDLPES